MPLFDKAGVLEELDEGCVPLVAADDANTFVGACRKLRHWPREARIEA
jgi:catalase